MNRGVGARELGRAVGLYERVNGTIIRKIPFNITSERISHKENERKGALNAIE